MTVYLSKFPFYVTLLASEHSQVFSGYLMTPLGISSILRTLLHYRDLLLGMGMYIFYVPRVLYFSLAEQFSLIPHQNRHQSYQVEVEGRGQNSSVLQCRVLKALPA